MKSTYLLLFYCFLSCSGGRTPSPEPEQMAPDPATGPMSCQRIKIVFLLKRIAVPVGVVENLVLFTKSQEEAFKRNLEKRCSTEGFRTCLDENVCDVTPQAKCEDSMCITIGY